MKVNHQNRGMTQAWKRAAHGTGSPSGRPSKNQAIALASLLGTSHDGRCGKTCSPHWFSGDAK